MLPDSSETSRKVEIIVEASVKHTESAQKVAEAISKLFKGNGEVRVEKDKVQFVSSDIESLRFLKNQFRDRQVRTAARLLLLSNKGEDSDQTYLLLNKQAATVGIAAICDDHRESPLGPIVLRIRSDRLENVIEWLVEGHASFERS